MCDSKAWEYPKHSISNTTPQDETVTACPGSSHPSSCREAGEDEAAAWRPWPVALSRHRPGTSRAEHPIPHLLRHAQQLKPRPFMPRRTRVQQRTHACIFMSTSTARVALDDSIDYGSGSPTTSGLDPSVPVCPLCRLRADQLVLQATRPGMQRKQKQSKPSFQRLADFVSWSVVGLVVTRRRVRLRLRLQLRLCFPPSTPLTLSCVLQVGAAALL